MQSEGLANTLATELNDQLFGEYGPVLRPAVLFKVLGFPTAVAFRQALTRGNVHIPLFQIPKRRGRFALTRDVAIWLCQQSRRGTLK